MFAPVSRRARKFGSGPAGDCAHGDGPATSNGNRASSRNARVRINYTSVNSVARVHNCGLLAWLEVASVYFGGNSRAASWRCNCCLQPPCGFAPYSRCRVACDDKVWVLYEKSSSAGDLACGTCGCCMRCDDMVQTNGVSARIGLSREISDILGSALPKLLHMAAGRTVERFFSGSPCGSSNTKQIREN